jgi:ADP-ribose pyrophosphatase
VRPLPDLDFTETRADGVEVYHGSMLRVQRDIVHLHTGAEASREYIRHPGASAVLALTEDEQVVLEWQYRYAPGRHYVEIPAGKRDPGETPEQSARRELQEETGWQASEWSLLLEHDVAIAYTDERIHIFVARGLTSGPVARDEEEHLECFLLPFDEALQWLDAGRIQDSKTQVALLTYDRRFRRR